MRIAHRVVPRILASLLALLVFVCLPLEVILHAAVAHVATVQIDDAAGNNPSLTTGSFTPSAGNLLIATLINWNCSTTVSSIKLDGSTSFTAATSGTKAYEGATGLVAVYYLANVAGGAHTVTGTWAANCPWDNLFVTEASGAATSSPQDGACVSAENTSTTPASGSFTTVATSFIYGAQASGNAGATTPGSGWTEPANGDSGVGIGSIEYKANPGTTSHNADFTAGNANWGAVGCAFLVVSAATPPSLSLLGVGR